MNTVASLACYDMHTCVRSKEPMMCYRIISTTILSKEREHVCLQRFEKLELRAHACRRLEPDTACMQTGRREITDLSPSHRLSSRNCERHHTVSSHRRKCYSAALGEEARAFSTSSQHIVSSSFFFGWVLNRSYVNMEACTIYEGLAKDGRISVRNHFAPFATTHFRYHRPTPDCKRSTSPNSRSFPCQLPLSAPPLLLESLLALTS